MVLCFFVFFSSGASALDLERLNALDLRTLAALNELEKAGAAIPPTPPLHPDDFERVMR